MPQDNILVIYALVRGLLPPFWKPKTRLTRSLWDVLSSRIDLAVLVFCDMNCLPGQLRHWKGILDM